MRSGWTGWRRARTSTRNLLHDNGPAEDLFVEVNHGPFLVDNNVMLSDKGILINSRGGAYAHNLVAGKIRVIHGEKRLTPYQKPHSTEVAGLAPNPSGDDRYYNNIFLNAGLPAYDKATLPVFMAGNVFLNGAKPSKHELDPTFLPGMKPQLKSVDKADGKYLQITLDGTWAQKKRRLVTTDLLGNAKIPNLPYEQPDGAPYCIDTDYLGEKRNASNPFPGPFEYSGDGIKTVLFQVSRSGNHSRTFENH